MLESKKGYFLMSIAPNFFYWIALLPNYRKGEVWNKNIQEGNMTKEKNNILNKVFAAVQTLGPSLTTGIAVIPLGGLLMGLASILTNATFTEMLPFLQNSVVIAIATLFQNIGSLIINNLAVIFCVSVAMSYCKRMQLQHLVHCLDFLRCIQQ